MRVISKYEQLINFAIYMYFGYMYYKCRLIAMMDSFKMKQNNPGDTIIECIQFQRVTIFTFSFFLYTPTKLHIIIMSTYKARSTAMLTYQTTEKLLKKNCLSCVYCVQFNKCLYLYKNHKRLKYTVFYSIRMHKNMNHAN